MKVEMIELPESMAIHVKKLSELLGKAHMVSVAIGTLNAQGEALKGLKESRAKFEDEWIRATDDGTAHADEQMEACVGTAVDMIGKLIEDMFEIGIIDRAGAERIKAVMDRNIEKARKGEL